VTKEEANVKPTSSGLSLILGWELIIPSSLALLTFISLFKEATAFNTSPFLDPHQLDALFCLSEVIGLFCQYRGTPARRFGWHI
jgi:hypothetical protein